MMRMIAVVKILLFYVYLIAAQKILKDEEKCSSTDELIAIKNLMIKQDKTIQKLENMIAKQMENQENLIIQHDKDIKTLENMIAEQRGNQNKDKQNLTIQQDKDIQKLENAIAEQKENQQNLIIQYDKDIKTLENVIAEQKENQNKDKQNLIIQHNKDIKELENMISDQRENQNKDKQNLTIQHDKDIQKLEKMIAEQRGNLNKNKQNLTIEHDKDMKKLENMIAEQMKNHGKIFKKLNSHLNQQAQERVAFSAMFSKKDEVVDMQKNQTVVYSFVRYNLGNGYESYTGKFRCPVSGTYVFFFNIIASSGKTLAVVLRVNGNNIIAYAYGGSIFENALMNGSNMAIVHLKKGDTVCVRSVDHWTPSQGSILKSSVNSFSGFLLYHT